MKKYIIGVAIILYALLPNLDQPTANYNNIEKSYDVVVIGAEPEGVAAAVSSARNGKKTLLVAKRDGLGGVMTYGMLNFLDLSKDKNGDPANAGIFKEWHKLVGGKTGFDIKVAKKAFLTLVLEEKNLTLFLETKVEKVIKNGDRLIGVQLKNDLGEKTIVKAKRFIDSTQDAEIAAKAGVPYFVGGEDIGLENKKMAVTLMIHLENVDWEQIKQAAKSGVFGGGEVHTNVIWGFSKLHIKYKPKHAEKTRLRGLNVVRQNDESVVINALQIFEIDGLVKKSKEKGIKIGKDETRHILKFLKDNFPGFQEAEIASFPDELYVRETRHIKAEYQLPLSDIWENKDHWDSIGLGAYPVDIQATSINDYGYVLCNPVQYAIPFRSLVPLKIDGLLVASKASGYSSLAASSARVLPVGMTTGQAAGVAASVSIDHNISFREMTGQKKIITKLQAKLKNQGANLYPFEIDYPYESKWFYPGLKTLLNYGLVVGGYENKLPIGKPIEELSFANILSNGVKRIASQEAKELRKNIPTFKEMVIPETELTRNKAAKMILTLFGITYKDTESWNKAYAIGLINEQIFERITKNSILTGSEGYYIAGKILENLQ
ncbi:FAD-dependent oxidoreductase [Virgibacillus necropolis]|uniref:FAD-dependent oxidoreductase n=1 Tax=Virgibacillus necropolis TaxID=163877 RepID=UPI00384D3F08